MVKLEDDIQDLKKVLDITSNPSVAIDLVTSLCGEHLGAGAFRDVFVFAQDPSYVIKIEPGGHNCNQVEAMIWDEVQYLTNELAWVKDWFAPVDWVSPNGKILVMKRTFERGNRTRPEKIPSFLWDVKPDNFGWIGNKFVCHDYGQFYNFIKYSKRMQKINWGSFR